MSMLWKEITAGIKSAARKNTTPCFRLNLTSDLPWEKIKFNGQSVMEGRIQAASAIGGGAAKMSFGVA